MFRLATIFICLAVACATTKPPSAPMAETVKVVTHFLDIINPEAIAAQIEATTHNKVTVAIISVDSFMKIESSLKDGIADYALVRGDFIPPNLNGHSLPGFIFNGKRYTLISK